MDYLIWSFKHAQWWAPNENGYVPDIAKAGRYSQLNAGRIVTNGVFNESLAVIEPIALENGPPKFHPYQGKQSDGTDGNFIKDEQCSS